MVQSTFIIRGSIQDFTRVDNLYKIIKREGDKLLKEWTIDVEVKYSEKEGEITE